MRIATKINKLQVLEALKKTGGFRGQAAEMLGITYMALSKKIQSSTMLIEAEYEITESQLDLAESQLIKAVQDGNLSAIKYYLDNKGKSRGYGKHLIGNQQGGRVIENGTSVTVEESASMVAQLVDNMPEQVKATLIDMIVSNQIEYDKSNDK